MARRIAKCIWDFLLRLLPALFTIPVLASEIDPSAFQEDAAIAVSASGEISTIRKGQRWAISPSDHLWIESPIVSGRDGYGNFRVDRSTSFEVFAHTRAVFRANSGNLQDVIDLQTGRVTLRTGASMAVHPLRITTPIAVIETRGPAIVAIAMDDEDGSARIDVEQGQIMVRHALLPSSDPVLVEAGDAIAVQGNEPLISRRLDRGSLYRDVFRSVWKTLGSAIPGHFAHEENDFRNAGELARSSDTALAAASAR